MKRVAVLASGRGTNLGALIAAQVRLGSYRVSLLISNVADSGALLLAQNASIEALLIPSKGVERSVQEQAIFEAVSSRIIDMVCLAGYMRVLSSSFIDRLSKPILNIHPSLLPAFPGLYAQRQALEAGVRFSGATVHLVDSGLDTGPILLQEPAIVERDDTEASLSARILEVEHRLYPQAVDLVARDRYEIRGRVVYLGDSEK